jgi:hypothetical protein
MTYLEAEEYLKDHDFVTTGEGVYEVVKLKEKSIILNPWSGNCWDDQMGVEYPLRSVYPYEGAI